MPNFNMKKILTTFLFGFISIAIVLTLAYSINNSGTVYNVSYSDFIEMVEDGKVEKVIMDGEQLKIYPYESKDLYITNFIENSEFVETMMSQDVEVEKHIDKENVGLDILITLLSWFLPILFMFWLLGRFLGNMQGRGGENNLNIFNAGKNKSKMYKENDTGVKFTDVAGQEEAKESLVEIIDYLHNADKYQSIGAKLPKGALLVGPPGTGKTLLAKAVAGEAGVPFFHLSGSEFIEMFVGVGASRVRDLFEEAKNNAPCIIFIDEIDAIGKSRDSGAKTGGHDEREQTLNQLLAEMDGFDSSKAIVVLAATNRPEILDKALLRPGRFDRRIIVDKPDLKGRVDILKVHIKDVCVDETVNLTAIAQATAGAAGADLAKIINEAALRAVKHQRTAVSQEDLMESVELVFAGKEKKDRIMSERERKIVAYHEVGHAVIAALQKDSAPVQKITIVPRTMGSLGYTMQVPEEEKFLYSKEDMLNEINTLIGGRCAEEEFFGIITTGASNDIEKVTSLARKLITIYGMSDKFDMVAFEAVGNYYLDGELTRNCSEKTSAIIDDEIVKIVKNAHRTVKIMIQENVDLINEVANYLLNKENITGEEFMTIFRKYHPASEEKDEKEFITPKLNIYDTILTEQQEENSGKENIKEVSIPEEPISVEDNIIEPIVNIDDSPLDIEEPVVTEEDASPILLEEPTIESSPLDEMPMPDFQFPFEETTNASEKDNEVLEEVQNVDSKNKENEDKKEEKTTQGFAAPAPLKKKGKNKNKKQKPQIPTTDEKTSGMDMLMDTMKTNPQELAQNKKKGVYINTDDKKSEEIPKAEKEITEDDY